MALALIAIVWTGITLYALLGGADFGAGILHLLARGGAAHRQRAAITAAIGPVWEANHVWLIFAITGLLSAFPRAFDALGMLAFAPATLALIAIVVRGAAFAFSAAAEGEPKARVLFERLFGAASIAAPFLFGTIAGGLARDRPAGQPGFWIGPFQLAVGALAVAICAALAAVLLTVESQRSGDRQLTATFRKRALLAVAGVVALAIACLAVASVDAPRLSHGLTHRALPELVIALVGLAGALASLARRQYSAARAAIALAIVAMFWGWGFAQYPRIVGTGATVTGAAASGPELTAVTVAVGGGLALLVPSLWLLYVAFRRHPLEVQK